MKIIFLIVSGALSLSSSVFAENVNPPSGPYRSLVETNGFVSSTAEVNESGFNNSRPNVSGTNENKRSKSSVAQQNITETSNENNATGNSTQASETDWNRQRINNMQPGLNQQNHQQPQSWGAPQYNQPEPPAWVKQRQQEMQERMQGFYAQQQAHQQAQQDEWKKRQAWERNQPVKPETSQTQPEAAQNGQLQQYFPSARGQVYGPESAPPAYYMPHAQPRQPVYQARRPMPQYQPRW